jgi:hypothetical protein
MPLPLPPPFPSHGDAAAIISWPEPNEQEVADDTLTTQTYPIDRCHQEKREHPKEEQERTCLAGALGSDILKRWRPRSIMWVPRESAAKFRTLKATAKLPVDGISKPEKALMLAAYPQEDIPSFRTLIL